jgi:valyl-tRNA synthetase
MSTELSTRYDASQVEAKWYAQWEAAGLFRPDPDPAKRKYTITIPPPNITGSLHMGHALCYPLQDAFGRLNRLRGFSVLVLPGQDHAGIATQSVVEKMLRKEGTSGAQLGREKFTERVWMWRKESGDNILQQLRTLGCAFDWEKLRFTLDPLYHEAVLKVFIDWFNKGLIYRGKRVVNWDPVLKTSVSDIETERKTIRGKLYYINYPFADGTGHVTIATTRPETMLGDVAVAVHPSDARYTNLIGKTIILPLVHREIQLIADQYPDPAFGSGAVKITPAHDPNDYEVGMRHQLPMPVLLTEDGRITEEGGPYAGLDRNEARKRVVEDLEKGQYLEKIEDYDIPILVSERSGEVIEPLLSEQWFVKQSELAKRSVEAVHNGEVKFFPDRYNGIFSDWMTNIRDWCISRQLWWGHRIPVYYDEAGNTYAALNQEDAQAQAGENKIVRQDDDVLDTWFSSGLWPFATLGWPEQTQDLQDRYPTDLLITDRNIINLWVARMMMMGFDQMGKKPFGHVMIYATVLNEQGRRMSKSLGTGIDPQEIIAKVGADALRYTLMSQTGANQDLRYSEKKTEEARNFCNKIWNATRFVLMNLDASNPAPKEPSQRDFDDTDRWLLSRLKHTEEAVKHAYDNYDLQLVCQTLYRFFWSELCDWYIEVSKSRLNEESSRATPQWVLLTAIEAFLIMLHPIMPHLTEELYSNLPTKKADFLMAAKWPDLPASFANPEAEKKIETVFEVVRQFRALRAEVEITPREVVPMAYYQGDLSGTESILRSQGWIADLHRGTPAEGQFFSATAEGVDVHLPIAGLVDTKKLCESTKRDIDKTGKELEKLEARLQDPTFIERAKPEVVERDRETAEELKAKRQKLTDRLSLLNCE